jgi:hypothetical protein
MVCIGSIVVLRQLQKERTGGRVIDTQGMFE